MQTQQQLLAKAVAMAAVAHQNQFDKADAPYILHPIRLMMRARSIDEKIVALLHDIVEDTDWTLDGLRAEGFPDEIVDAVDSLTSRRGESYDDFISRVMLNPLAMRVKLLDIEDNLDITRIAHYTERDEARLRKYHAARARLIEALGASES